MLLLNFLCITILFPISFGKECKDTSDNYQYHLGSKMPYRFLENSDATKLEFPGCKPQKFWMILRHGTRNPSLSFIEKMNERLTEIRDLILENNVIPSELLRNSDLYALKKWKVKLADTDYKILTHEGENEMIELAERMQSRFPTLLPFTYSNTTFLFRSTVTQRTKASAKYFAAGLFGRSIVKSVWFPKPIKNDPILKFYNRCNRWKNLIKKNPTFQEVKLFENDLPMFQALATMNAKLNLENNLALDDLYLIYTLCSFETAWNRKRKSPWCSVIPFEALKVMEFAEDLKYYYKDGYSYEINYKQACPLFKDMINFFEKKSNYPKVAVYFTHSEALLKTLALLGLYKDTNHPTHSEYENIDRKWKTSKINSFGSNLAFILYECGSRQKVAVLHQERLIQLPKCKDLCDLVSIKKFYNDSINNCNFREMCNDS